MRNALLAMVVWACCGVVVAAPARTADARPPSGLVGRVVDATNGLPVPSARLAMGGQTATVDADGRFTVPLPPGSWSVRISARDYKAATVDVTVQADTMTEVDVRLAPEAPFREEVEVVAPAETTVDSPAVMAMAPEHVVEVAGGGENVFRVLQTLPGVTGTDEFSGRLSVRGGGPDQNLTVMDGVEIHNPYRLFGLASAFNPETVKHFELTAGAFSARYGDRLSSLLVVENRDGATERAISGSAAASLTDSNLILEGPIKGDRGSWLVTGRRTYYDVVAERFTDNDLPSFGDLQGRTVFKLGGGRTLSFFSLISRETTDASFNFEEEFAEGAIFSRSRNDLASATFYSPLGHRGWMRSIASTYKSTDSFDFDGSFRDEERRSNSVDDSGFGQAELAITWDGAVRDDSFRQEIGTTLGDDHVLDAGFELHRLDTHVGFTLAGSRNQTEGNGSSLQGGASLPDELDSSHVDSRFGAWVQDEWQLGSRLRLTAGLRLDHTTINDRTEISPRLSATWRLTPQTRLRTAVGIHTQSPGYEKLMQSDYFMDLSSDGPLPIANERARHVLVSLERDLPAGWTTRVEGFYKGFDRLIVGRLETPEETLERAARYDFPEELASSVPRDPQVTTFPTNDGRGTGWGFDVYLARRATSRDTRLTGWASYTFGRAFRESFGRRYPFDYDRRHALSIVANIRATRRLDLATTVRLASGFPYTPALGLRVSPIEDPNDPDRLIPETDPAGNLVYTIDRGDLDNLNAAQLPFYARVDARATYTPQWGRGNLRLYLDFINVLGRDNAGMIISELEHDPASDQPRIVDTAEGAMPFLPSFGIHFTFGARKRAAPTGDVQGKALVRRGPRRFAVALRPVASQGFGLDLFARVSSRFNARLAGAVPMTLALEESTDGNDYDMDLNVGSASALLDWHPTGGRFHVSGGAWIHRHGFDFTAQPAATYRLGGHEYPAAETGTLKASADLRPLSPYLGVGWGNPVGRSGRFGVNVDLGVVTQRTKSLTLEATGPAAADPGFQIDLAQEATALRDRVDALRFFPAISLSMSFGL